MSFIDGHVKILQEVFGRVLSSKVFKDIEVVLYQIQLGRPGRVSLPFDFDFAERDSFSSLVSNSDKGYLK